MSHLVGEKVLQEEVCANSLVALVWKAVLLPPTNFCFLSVIVPMICGQDGEHKGEERGVEVERSSTIYYSAGGKLPQYLFFFFLAKVTLLKSVCIKGPVGFTCTVGNHL